MEPSEPQPAPPVAAVAPPTVPTAAPAKDDLPF